jgi:hypothetical protein
MRSRRKLITWASHLGAYSAAKMAAARAGKKESKRAERLTITVPKMYGQAPKDFWITGSHSLPRANPKSPKRFRARLPPW